MMKTPERVELAQELRADGLTYREIGEALGVALKTAHNWVSDPDGMKNRARKDSYSGTCVDCGSKTSGCNGRDAAPERCRECYLARDHERACAAAVQKIRDWADEHGGIPPSAPDWNPGLAEAGGRPEAARVYRDANGRWPAASDVQHLFGSWNAGIRAAGFEPRQIGHYGREGEDPEVIAETVRLYRSGLSLAEVGEHMGISTSGVLGRLIKAGEPRRPTGRHKAAA